MSIGPKSAEQSIGKRLGKIYLRDWLASAGAARFPITTSRADADHLHKLKFRVREIQHCTELLPMPLMRGDQGGLDKVLALHLSVRAAGEA